MRYQSLTLFRVFLGDLKVLENTEQPNLLALSDFFSSLTLISFIELFYGLYWSGSVEAVRFQITLMYLYDKVGYAILYSFNLIRGVYSYISLDSIDDKNPRVFKVLLEKNLELLLDY